MAESVRHTVEKVMGKSKPAPVIESTRESVDRAFKQEGGDEKHGKSQVDYGQGTKDEHCGNCKHFQVLTKNGCELVAGYIEYEDWCRLWEEKPDETVFVDQ